MTSASICGAAALTTKDDIQPEVLRNIGLLPIVEARDDLRGLWAVQRGPRGLLHLFFDKAHGWKPTLIAETNFREPLNKKYENAKSLSRSRWKQTSNGEWFPEAMELAYFFEKTAGTFSYMKTFKFKCYWIDLNTLPANLFDPANISSNVGEKMSLCKDWMQAVDKIKDLN